MASLFSPIHLRISRIINKEFLFRWFDRVDFQKILIIWMVIIIFFGLFYIVFTNENSYLIYPVKDIKVSNALDSIYFSFVAATTTGFGDIVPHGIFKLIAIVEVVLGLMLLAFVTSKLVSIKQNIILDELYDISFYEKINRIRSSLLLFRQHFSNITSNVEEGSLKRRITDDIEQHGSSFLDTLSEIHLLFVKQHDYRFVIKELDPMNTELIFNSIIQSFEKIEVLVGLLDKNKIKWRNNLTLSLATNCLERSEEIFKSLDYSKSLSKNTIGDLKSHHERVTERIKNILKQKEEK